MKRRLSFFWILLSLILANEVFAYDYPSVPHTFVARQIISSSQTNANNTAWANAFSDGTKKANFAELYINSTRFIDNSRNLTNIADITATGAGAITGSWAVDNLKLDGNVFSSTSGAVTVTPLAGQNLNVSLSTTGDFVVNTDDFYIDTSAANVGIGTATPQGSLSLGNSVGKSKLLIYDGGSGGTVYAGFAIDTPVANDFTMYAHNSGLLKFGKMGTDFSTVTTWLTIDNNGNVGINDITPTYKLDVDGTLRATGAATFDSSLTAVGNVGINDTTPDFLLDVAGTFNADGAATFGSTLGVTGITTARSTTVDCLVLRRISRADL